jgi:hypothetical protein
VEKEQRSFGVGENGGTKGIFAAWGHGRSVRLPAASQLGGDRVARWVAREACTGWLTCGDLGQFK